MSLSRGQKIVVEGLTKKGSMGLPGDRGGQDLFGRQNKKGLETTLSPDILATLPIFCCYH